MTNKISYVGLDSEYGMYMRESLGLVVLLEVVGVSLESQGDVVPALIIFVRAECDKLLAKEVNGEEDPLVLEPVVYTSDGVPVFSTIGEWLLYFYRCVEISSIEHLALNTLREIEKIRGVEKEGEKILRRSVLNSGKQIPLGMQKRMSGEVWGLLKARLAPKGLVHRLEFEKHVDECIERFKSGVGYGGQLQEFEDGDAQVLFNDIDCWIAYYMREYPANIIRALLMSLFVANHREHFMKFVKQEIKINDDDWYKLLNQYPLLADKRDKFDEVLYRLFQKDITGANYVYTKEGEGRKREQTKVKISQDHLHAVTVLIHPGDVRRIRCTAEYSTEDEGGGLLNGVTNDSAYISHILKQVGEYHGAEMASAGEMGGWFGNVTAGEA